jgi:hypothetical protein
MKRFNDKVTILILDYNKKEESLQCLESVQEHCKFNKEVIFYSNGGEQDYVVDFYKRGLIDKCLLSSKNFGLGVGTTDLLQLCRTEYFIYLQQDQFFWKDITEEDIEIWKNTLEDTRVGAISLAGFPCGANIYSDRCHFAKTDFFRGMDNWGEGMPDCGCGPFWNGAETYNENFIQRYFKEFDYVTLAVNPPPIVDNGKTSIRENPDGSIWSHRPSTKELKLIKGPVKEKFGHPNLTDDEWNLVLETQSWPEGKIPERELSYSFKVEGWD